MKKQIMFLFFLYLIGICFAYSKPDKLDKDMVTVTGYIRSYGNDPFTFIGLVTDSGAEYSIIADEKNMKEIQKAARYKIQVKGKINKSESTGFNELKDGNLIVIEWKTIK